MKRFFAKVRNTVIGSAGIIGIGAGSALAEDSAMATAALGEVTQLTSDAVSVSTGVLGLVAVVALAGLVFMLIKKR